MELWGDINNTTCCYITYNCQSALSICSFAFPFIDWWWMQALLCTDHNHERDWIYKRGKPKELAMKDEKDYIKTNKRSICLS